MRPGECHGDPVGKFGGNPHAFHLRPEFKAKVGGESLENPSFVQTPGDQDAIECLATGLSLISEFFQFRPVGSGLPG